MTYEGRSWGEADVTVAQALVVSELLERDRWQDVQPTASPRACVAWLATLLAVEAGVSVEEAQAAVLALPLSTLVGCLSVDDEEPPVAPEPPDAGVREPRAPKPRGGAGKALATV